MLRHDGWDVVTARRRNRSRTCPLICALLDFLLIVGTVEVGAAHRAILREGAGGRSSPPHARVAVSQEKALGVGNGS